MDGGMREKVGKAVEIGETTISAIPKPRAGGF
jgi:hypothetical protein